MPVLKRRILEKAIERMAVYQLEKRGCVTLKLNVMFNRSWPDRLVITPDGPMFFVELKRPGAVPTPAQEVLHARLRRMGQRVYVCRSVAEVVNAYDKETA